MVQGRSKHCFPVIFHTKALLGLMILMSRIQKYSEAANDALKAKGFDDACNLAATLRQYAHFSATMASKLPATLFTAEQTLAELKQVLTAGGLQPTDDDINIYMYIDHVVETAKAHLQTQLPNSIKKAAASSEAAGAIMETAELFVGVADTTKYCIANEAGNGIANQGTDLRACMTAGKVNRKSTHSELTNEPNHAAALDAIGTGVQTTKGNVGSAGCRLTQTTGGDGIVNGGSNGQHSIHLAAGLLKISSGSPGNSMWDKATHSNDNNPIQALETLKSLPTSGLTTSLAALKTIVRYGEEPENHDFKEVQTTKATLGLSETADAITITKAAQQRVNDALKKQRQKHAENPVEQITLAKRQAIKALLSPKPQKPQTCVSQQQKDNCNDIKEEAACNASAACSFNNTETDDNKKCKFNATKALKSGVPVTQAQAATGTENGKTASDRCTKHKDKENCEKENEGQKPGEKAKCGWIEDKCKDSSFLATKKFALSVVSAAFVALLF
uniref:Variant surface glycoprotein n=1 Tax=Trypanosoma brucei TaxID=5691 RepID=A0A1V0FXV4_9TRYP|nr:variant surface glycoprotein [Trypanosoma brucei]